MPTILDRKLLILDEATAALDNESEKIVQAALDEMQVTNPRTTLTVAHRLETVKVRSPTTTLQVEMLDHSKLITHLVSLLFSCQELRQDSCSGKRWCPGGRDPLGIASPERFVSRSLDKAEWGALKELSWNYIR